jgi:hypothetical protein
MYHLCVTGVSPYIPPNLYPDLANKDGVVSLEFSSPWFFTSHEVVEIPNNDTRTVRTSGSRDVRVVSIKIGDYPHK